MPTRRECRALSPGQRRSHSKLVPGSPCGVKRIKSETCARSIDAKVTLPRFTKDLRTRMVAHSLMEMLLLAACLVRYATALAPGIATAIAPGIISEQRFLQLCQASINCNRPLELRGRRVVLSEAVKVQRQDNLTIRGPGRIDGSGHSVVQVEGTGPGLSLIDVDLRHVPSTDRTEKRSLGACVFCRGRGAIRLDRCRLTSECRCPSSLRECRRPKLMRSAWRHQRPLPGKMGNTVCFV